MKSLSLFFSLLLAMTSIAATAPSPEFAIFDQKARAGETLSVVFLGGSLTWGAQSTNPQQTSYRAIVQHKLEETYPKAHFQFHDAAIGGTGSQLASFRLERDVLAYKPDLVFLDYTINDDPYGKPNPHRLAAYEGIVRRIVSTGAPMVAVILPAKKDVESNPPARPLDARHKEIASAYGLPIADAVALAKARVAEGKTSPDQLWDLPEDHTHPGDAGYALYADAAWAAYLEAVAKSLKCAVPEKMIQADTYMTVTRLVLAAQPSLPAGWSKGKPHRNAVAYDFVCSRWMDSLAIAAPGAKPLRFRVYGSDLMLFGEQTKTSGSYVVKIDGGEPKKYSALCADGNMRLVQILAEGLDPAVEHMIEILPDLAAGQELRLESLCVAGGKASVQLAD
ncbi:lysophospholiPASe L1 [Terrimicrobium sacchariphilum]|uniref:LysophospholiPASe L1 n=1 Tax=Terrimicrobium sacchariphilum TaxID=690879 RepID=A0A146G4Y1_TERSA|nr:SGNH/GDSL hydrolase family protein [Terrimicrobium sacchariphilum]GAT31878.1 lysophospholiPASe L1 [Terrimicrobium sacchariphilum]